MADDNTGQDGTRRTGTAPGGISWKQFMDVLVGTEDDQLFVTSLLHALEDGARLTLHQANVKDRLARVRARHFELYDGVVLALVQEALPQRWRDWERDVEIRALALAELDLVPLSQITREPLQWLWHPYIPLKKLTLLEGDASAGKTYLI